MPERGAVGTSDAMVTALVLVGLAAVAVLSFRMSWAAHGLPFAALFLVIGLIAQNLLMIVCAVVVACSALLMAMRRRRGQPMWRE